MVQDGRKEPSAQACVQLWNVVGVDAHSLQFLCEWGDDVGWERKGHRSDGVWKRVMQMWSMVDGKQ